MKQRLARKFFITLLLAFYSFFFVFPQLSLAGSLPTEKQFTGHVFDQSSDLYYMRARYYDPVIGRFLSPDDQGDPGDRGNRYLYAGNNPVNLVDPSGHQYVDPMDILRVGSLGAFLGFRGARRFFGENVAIDIIEGNTMAMLRDLGGIVIGARERDVPMVGVAAVDLLTEGQLERTTISANRYRDDPTDPANAVSFGFNATFLASEFVGMGQMAGAGARVAKGGDLFTLPRREIYMRSIEDELAERGLSYRVKSGTLEGLFKRGGRTVTKGQPTVTDIQSIEELSIGGVRTPSIMGHEFEHILQVESLLEQNIPTSMIEVPPYSYGYDVRASLKGLKVGLQSGSVGDVPDILGEMLYVLMRSGQYMATRFKP